MMVTPTRKHAVFLRSSSGLCRESSSFYIKGLFILTLVGCSAAQDFRVTVEINVSTTAILPDEVDYLTIMATTPISITGLNSDPSDQLLIQNHTSCTGVQCTVDFRNSSVKSLDIVFLNEEGNQQVLNVTVRADLNYSCSSYPVPVRFVGDSSVMDYNLTCNPISTTNRTVRWRRFRDYSDVLAFQQSGAGFMDEIITINENFTFSGDIDQILTASSVNHFVIAYYYVPSFLVESSNLEEVTAETSIYVLPTIITPRREFSLEVIFGTESAQVFTRIRCETEAFPPATVEWNIVSTEYPGSGENLANINNSRLTLVDTGTLESINKTFNGLVNFTDLQYTDDGNFTCTASNEFGSASQAYVLRVKSNLRPLWPAIGIMGVIILTAVFMFFSFSVETIIEKKKTHHRKSNPSSPDHSNQRLSSISSSGATYNSSKRGSNTHTAAKRLSSAKPLLDEAAL